MKKLLASILMALVAVTGNIRAEEGSFPDISIADLKKAIEEKKATVIDVNGSKSFEKGHVPGAHDFASIKADLATKLPKEKDALIVAYCGGPQCSAYKSAAKAAKELGYTNVKHLSAGISGWTKAGEKTEAAKKEESKEDKKTSTEGAKHSYVATFTGVTCAGCKSHVKDAIAKLPGGADVAFAKGAQEGTQTVTFTATCDSVCKGKLAEALGEDAKTYVVQDLKLADNK
jgi:rhodanese-related sulfurtransferase/copper chaperone CopZ